MLAAIVLDLNAHLRRQLRIALRLASARDADLLCLLPTPVGAGKSGPEAEAAARAKAMHALREADAAVDTHQMPGDRDGNSDGDEVPPGATPATAVPPHSIKLESIANADTDAVLAAVATHRPSTLIVVLRGGDIDQALARDGGRALLQRAPCEVVLLRLGDADEEPASDVLVPVSSGTLSLAPLRLGHDLARASGDGKLTAVLVEPPIGADAEAVGQKVLERRVTRALGKNPGDLVTHVVVARDQQDGVLRACEDDRPGLVVLGTTPFARLGNRDVSRVVRQLIRRRADLDIALVRAPMPVTNRARLWIEVALQRVVPQLERDQRVGLAERVQSSSAWDFDFVALISLSALIAAMGLVQDSVAVVIGAMLVAPLMTPILGIGLALVHGNAALARLAARAIGFGVATAWLLGLLIGALHTDLHEPTREMLARGWPHPLDLLVAFVSGLAAAYATSRPNLVSALPGVAIAASLVPPLATSGLFASIGYGEASLGAFLLFLTNMVAIVLAAAVALWAVGIRSVKGASRWTRVVGNSLIAVSLALALYLGLSPEHDIRGQRVPDAAAQALRTHIAAAGFRIVELNVRPGRPTAWLEVRLGGPARPRPELTAELGALARPHFSVPIRVRLRADLEEAELAGR